jgi:chromosome segregation ATPase
MKRLPSVKKRVLKWRHKLNTAQQHMQHMQEELTATTGQMEQAKQLAQKEAERAVGLEGQLSQRNQQVAGIIQNLATSFDLGERPVAGHG